VNLIFAGIAFTGGAVLLKRQPSPVKLRLDIPGALLVSGAATHSWATPSTYGFLAAGVALGAVFALWQGRAAHPLLPPRVVLDRNRGGAYLSMLIAAAGLFGTFLSSPTTFSRRWTTWSTGQPNWPAAAPSAGEGRTHGGTSGCFRASKLRDAVTRARELPRWSKVCLGGPGRSLPRGQLGAGR